MFALPHRCHTDGLTCQSISGGCGRETTATSAHQISLDSIKIAFAGVADQTCTSDLAPILPHSCLVSYEPLHHKYRPQIFADLVGQEAIATTLSNAIRTERIAPAYLFTGPRGTGKTSSARILAKSLNCKKQDKPTESPCGLCETCKSITSGSALDVIEIDAASNTGVDNIREIIERAQFAPVQCRYKVYVVDECHMLSVAAFNALLKTLEEPPERVVFVLATTDPQRVLPTIISRCQKFDFRRIPLEAMVKHLLHIASKENINITLDAITLVAQVAQGGLRDAESLLDQLSLLPDRVTVEAVWDLVGAVPERDLMALAKAIASDNTQAVLDQCRRLMDRGREPLVVLQNLAGFYRDLLIAKTAPNRSDLVAVMTPTWNKLCEFVKQLAIPDILQGQQHLKNSEAQIKNTTQPRLWLEVTLLGLLKSANSPQLQEVRSDRPLKREEPISTPPALAGQGGSRSPLPNTSSQTPAIASISANNASTQPVSPKEPSPQEQVSNAPPQSPQGDHSESSPPSSQSAESVKASSNLEQVWQQVLAYLPLGSKALFGQHGYLLTFNNQQAQVGIRAPKLIKMAQPRLPDLELAFQKAYNQKIKVNLVVNQPSTAQTTSVEELPVSTSTPEVSFSTSTPLAPATEAKRDVVNEDATTPSLSEKSSPVSPQIMRQQELTSVTSQPSRLPEREVAQTLQPPTLFVPDWNADEAEKALGNLKHFFEGEIIDLSDDFLDPEIAIAHQPQLEEAELAEGDRLSINISQATSDSPVVATLEASVIPLAPRLPKNQESTLAMPGTFEEPDSIEPVIVRQFPLSKMTSQDNSLNSLAQGDGEDEDDIPF